MSVGLLKQAKAALERSAIGLSELSLRLKKSAAGASRAHRIVLEETVSELARLHTVLTGYYNDMILAPKEELPALWQRFYVCYDEYLEAVRLANTGLAREDRLQGQSAVPRGAQLPAGTADAKEG